MLLRTALLGLILAGLVTGYQALMSKKGDLTDVGTADTKDWIAAIEEQEAGAQAVVIKPDGTVLKSANYVSGALDRDLAWRPDGNRLFFSSDRARNEKEKASNIFRWNLANDQVEQRSVGKIGKTQPSFAPGEEPGKELTPLFCYGGTVWELDPNEGKGIKIIPSADGSRQVVDVNEESKGVGGFGEGSELKIRYARYLYGKKGILYIRRTETGESVWFQADTAGLSAEQMATKGQAQLLATGEKCAFDVSPTEDIAVITTLSFSIPEGQSPPKEFIKDGKLVLPFRHSITIFSPEKGLAQMISSGDDKVAFGQPSFSPDGKQVAVLIGPFVEGDIRPRAIVSMPPAPNIVNQVTPILPNQGQKIDARSEISSLGWHPSGSKLLFVQRVEGKKDICTVGADGSGYKNLTEGKARYSSAVYSPQK